MAAPGGGRPGPFEAIVLAAGLGTRMRSERPKVLFEVLGRSLIEHVLENLAPLAPARTTVVVGAGADQVRTALADRGVEFALQDPPRGTGDALAQARTIVEGSGRPLLVLAGDVPLLRPESLASLLEATPKDGASVLTARLTDPAAYGRIIRRADGQVDRIVEARDASREELAVDEVNTGIYVFPENSIWPHLEALSPENAQGEYYLTDIIAALVADGRPVAAVSLDDPEEMTGVNDRAGLATVTRAHAERIRRRHLLAGVTLVDPASTWIDDTVTIEPDVVINPFVRLTGSTAIGRGSQIGSFSRLTDTSVGDDATILEGVVATDARIGTSCQIGPWTHLRPATELGNRVKVGNFVETKKARLGDGSKASHLSYLGDAEIGSEVNIGAGTITCNYDGEQKHQTTLEDGVFIGSDTQLVAPVKVGRGSYVGAGTTVTDDVPEESLAISRTKQRNIDGWVRRRIRKRKD